MDVVLPSLGAESTLEEGKRKTKKKRSLPLFAALLAAGVVAVLFVGSAIATSFDPPPDTYVSFAGTETHQTLPISNTSLEPDCT